MPLCWGGGQSKHFALIPQTKLALNPKAKLVLNNEHPFSLKLNWFKKTDICTSKKHILGPVYMEIG